VHLCPPTLKKVPPPLDESHEHAQVVRRTRRVLNATEMQHWRKTNTVTTHQQLPQMATVVQEH